MMEVTMQRIVEDIGEATITKWLVNVGDWVERDQPMFEISTSKGDAELPSPETGRVVELLFKEGDTVRVDRTIAGIDAAERIEVTMPQMGEDIAEATITRCFVQVGDWIERDQPMFEISTSKVDSEISSPVTGKVVELLFEVGDTVEINRIIALIDTGRRRNTWVNISGSWPSMRAGRR